MASGWLDPLHESRGHDSTLHQIRDGETGIVIRYTGGDGAGLVELGIHNLTPEMAHQLLTRLLEDVTSE